MPDHPYRTAWQTRELDPWIQRMAPEVVVRSPIIRRPFLGRAQTRELFEVLFDTVGAMVITHELADGPTRAFFWRMNIGAYTVEGSDWIHHNEQDEISEIRVLIRPLADIAVFAAAIGPPLAARHGPLRAPISRLLAPPLIVLLRIAEAIASRLTQSR